jgi:hypothetical protein
MFVGLMQMEFTLFFEQNGNYFFSSDSDQWCAQDNSYT